MNFSFEDLFPKAKSGMKVKDYASQIQKKQATYNSSKIKNEVFSKNNKGQAGLPIPASQLPFFRPQYQEGELIPEIDYPMGANVDPEQFNPNLKPYVMNTGPQPYTTMNYQGPEITQGPINTELALQGRQQKEQPSGRRGINGGAIAQGILGAIGAVSSVLPDKSKRFQPIQPKRTYNPFAQGTGSQAIMDGGGIIPTDDDNFWPYEGGGDPVTGQMKPSSDKSKNRANTAEILSYLAAKGANPLGTKGGSYLRTQALTGFDEATANELYNSMIAFSQRPDLAGMSPEQRINNYYDFTAKNKKLAGAIGELRNINYEPVAALRKSPVAAIANLTDEYLQPVNSSVAAVKKSGGKLKKK